MGRQILYIDMDEVLCDFYNHPLWPVPKDSWDHPLIYREGFFRGLPPLEGAIGAVNEILDSNRYDVYILTTPLALAPHSYSEKVEWIHEHLPRLKKKIIMIQNKGLVIGDYLIDDRPENCSKFSGKGLIFRDDLPSAQMWNIILRELSILKK